MPLDKVPDNMLTAPNPSDADIETAYNNQVDVILQAEAEAGTSTTVRRWTAERVKQAIDALGGGGGGALVPLSTVAFSTATAFVQFDNTFFTATYDEYEIHVTNVFPAVSNVVPYLWVSQTNAVTFEAAYAWVYDTIESGLGTQTVSNNAGASGIIQLGDTFGYNVGINGMSGVIKIHNPLNSTSGLVDWNLSYSEHATDMVRQSRGAGFPANVGAFDAFRFGMQGQNMSFGEVTLYGIAKS